MDTEQELRLAADATTAVGRVDPAEAPSRRPYHAPLLTAYGDIAKLTLGGAITGTDMSNLMMCL